MPLQAQTESELLPRERCQELMLAVQAAAYRHGVEDVEILLSASEESLTRFANNTIHQNVSERGVTLSIRPVIGERTARVTTNRLHRDGVSAAVDEAIALTRASEPVPDLPPLYEVSSHEGSRDESVETSRWSPEAAAATPAQRAAAVTEAIRVIEGLGQTAAGIYSTAENTEVIMNSRGVSRYYFETLTTFSVTAIAADSSGWAKATSTNHEDIRPVDLARSAARKAKLSAGAKELQPGAYTVVLEPSAVLDLVGQIFGDFSGTAVADQRSFLTDRVG